MANIVDNEKGFKIIEITRAEMMKALSKFGCLGICDFCGNPTQNGYYVAALNQWLCPKCYDDMMKDATYYPEDQEIEERNFNTYKKIFNIK